MIHKEVCIVGGGPAGITTSLFLSRLSIPHLLIERGAYPKNKVCGESFDGKVFHILKELNPDWLEALKAQGKVHPCWSYRLINSKGYHLPIQFSKNQTPRLHIKRLDFDDFLFNKAAKSPYLEYFEHTNVQKATAQDDGYLLSSSKGPIKTKLLVLATGDVSLLGKSLTARKQQDKTFLFARGHFKEVFYSTPSRAIDIFFLRQPFKGCLLICPLSEGFTNVEIGMPLSEWEKQKVSPANLLKQAISTKQLKDRFTKASLEGKIETTSIGLSTKKRIYSGDHFLVAGAAAGSINPVTGFGVGHAMLMGKLAAHQAAEAIAAGNYSANFFKQYDKTVYQKLKNEFLISNWNTRLLKQIDLMEPLIYLLSKGALLSNLLSDADLIKNLRNPFFYLRKMVNR